MLIASNIINISAMENHIMDQTVAISQFDFIKAHHPLMHKVLLKAEVFFYSDPDHTLVETRKFVELLVNWLAELKNLDFSEKPTLDLRIRMLDDALKLDSEFVHALHSIRKSGNKGAHEINVEHREALKALSLSYKVAQWLDMAITNQTDYVLKEYQRPVDPSLKTQEMQQELLELRGQLKSSKEKQSILQEIKQKNDLLQAENDHLKEQQQVEAFQTHAYVESLQQQIQELENLTTTIALPQITASQIELANQSFELSEAETREIIDAQLRQAGWEVNTKELTYAKGIRPVEGRNIAIAEYPTLLNGKEGQADYVLFAGLTPIAVVEAKKQNRMVVSALAQAERYSQGFQINGSMQAAFEIDKNADKQAWQVSDKVYYVPFVYSCNGRPYSQRLADESGIWFRDVRHASNINQRLQGFHSPTGLHDKLNRDLKAAHDYFDKTEILPFNDREYQREGIKAVERAIQAGKTRCLLAMATGTGKTRLANGLIYRLLNSKRFKRILFLVDRSSLGTQAHDEAFAANIITQNQTLAQIYTVSPLGSAFDTDSQLHVATVQSLVNRLFKSDNPLPVDFFDCIIIDEAHRGYSLDKEMTEGEESIRDASQYLSTYKRVLEYFDATLIALTATPALHTTDIFGRPVFTYSFTRAVEEGFLVNYESPIRYITHLSQAGIEIPAGTAVAVDKKIDLVELQDDMAFDVADFNRSVINESFNQVICQQLINDLNPLGDAKTLIFCVTDRHADQVCLLLNQLFKEKYGLDWNNDLVQKITGSIDNPADSIQRFKKSKAPNIAVTVDLLSTGIDVPEICNLVFMRKVRSRVLFEQMLGRATRLCKEIGKTEFKIYDAVDIFSTMEEVSTMKPIAVRPNIPLKQIIAELEDDELIEKARAVAVANPDGVKRTQADLLLDQLVQKVNRIVTKAEKYKYHPQQQQLRNTLEQIKSKLGVESSQLPQMLYKQGLDATRAWLKQNSAILEASLGAIQTAIGSVEFPIISIEEDHLIERIVDTNHKRPVDYLQQFEDFVQSQLNQHAAIKAIVTRPSDLTRQDLRELDNLLSSQGFNQNQISQAVSGNVSNQTYAAQTISIIRRAALGEEATTVEERYQRALTNILQKRAWNDTQIKWLERLTKFIAQEVIVDKDMVYHQFAKDGGIKRLSKLLESDVESLIEDISSSLWDAA